VQPGVGADASWFQIEPEVGEPEPAGPAAGAERALPVAGTATVDVTVRVPEAGPVGAAAFSLGAALEEAPQQVVSGPTVAFQVPPPPAQKRRFPWWIVIVAAVVLLVAGGILIWLLVDREPDAPNPEVSSAPSPSASPTWALLGEARESSTAEGATFDLDAGEADLEGTGAGDLDFTPVPFGFESALEVQGSLANPAVRISVAGDATVEACEAAPDYDDDDKQSIIVQQDAFTIVCVRFTDQDRMAAVLFLPMDEADKAMSSQKFTYLLWELTP
jgi:hypothetical protein